MPTRVVLDSTVFAALFFSDPLSEETARAVNGYDEFYTIDLANAEVGNVAWKRIRIFHEERNQVMESLKAALIFIEDNCKVMPAKDFLPRAVIFGLEKDITVYDSLFLCAAEQLKTRLLSTDEGLFRKLQQRLSKEVPNLVQIPS
jgi:predicted nucleic acid-binding protein